MKPNLLNLIDRQMKKLAELTGLEYDNGYNDCDDRLFAETIHTYSSSLSKSEYEEMQTKIDQYEKKGPGFTVYAWNDSSGYDYWTLKQNEDNYIQIIVLITDITKVKPDAVKKAVENAEVYFSEYAHS